MSNIDFEIDRLQEELQLETSRRDALQKSVHQSERDLSDLQNTLVEEYNYNSGNNNWKQKYEKQHEKNAYLEHELLLMKEKLEVLSKVDESTTSKKEDQPDLDLRLLLRQLEHEKCVLEGTVNDSYWRLDSEAKALFNLGEKKREYMLSLNQSLHSAPILNRKRHDWVKNRYHGIPDNQRIIDPRKGPIKKNACRVNLPKITTTEVNAVLSESKKRNQLKKTAIIKEKINSDPEIIRQAGKYFEDDIKNNEKNIIKNNENIDGVTSDKDFIILTNKNDITEHQVKEQGDDMTIKIGTR